MAVPRRSWFLLQPPSRLHGPGHTARVMTWAAVLARGTPWFDAVLWAAACHDLRRRDDGADPRHGFRAGAWVRRRLPGLLRRPPQELELVARACDWHVCPDRRSEWDHPSLWLLKDADGLDRARLGDLDPSYLRRPEARQRGKEAYALFRATAGEHDPAAVWRAAAAMGLPVSELVEWVARQEAVLRGVAGPPPPAREKERREGRTVSSGAVPRPPGGGGGPATERGRAGVLRSRRRGSTRELNAPPVGRRQGESGP